MQNRLIQNQIREELSRQFQKLLKIRNEYKTNLFEIYEEPPVGIEEFLDSPLYCPAAKQLRPVIRKMLIDIFTGNYFEVLLIAGIGSGKCHRKGTKILMYNGSIKKIEDIKVGDKLIGSNSEPKKVLSLARGKDLMYKIIPIKGNSFVVNQEHILSLKRTNKGVISKNGSVDKKAGDIVNVSVKDYLKLSRKMKKTVLKLWRVGVKFKTKKVDIDPYFLGLWLGDGNFHNIGITTKDKEIENYVYRIAKEEKLGVTINQNNYKICPTYVITGQRKVKNHLLDLFRNKNLLKNKHIPFNYRVNSEKIRLKILAGLIDTDGYQHNNCLEFSNKNKQLCEDVIFIARSLGFSAYINRKERITTCNGKKFKSYRVSISGDLEKIPVLLKRKKCSKRKQKKNVLMTGFSVKKLKKEKYYGFNLDNDGLYLLEDFTVTHNSFLASKAIEYISYQLLCLKNPQKFFHLADNSAIYIVNVSTNKDQANKVVFGEIKNRIDQSPWFQHFHKPNDNIRSEIRFDKSISIFPLGSNEAAPLGYNIFAGVIDEASFHIRTKHKDYAEASHNQMTKRVKSRFLDKGKMFIITSPRFVYDFAEKKFEEDKSPVLYKKRLALWDAMPKEQYCGKTFDLGEFYPEYKGKKIPIEYYEDFKKNPDLTMRDLGAVPSLAIQGFFKDSGIIVKNANKKRLNPIDSSGKLQHWVKAQDTEPRFIHLDLALGKEGGDACGFAMGKFNGWHEIKNKVTKKIERRPKIYIDIMHAFRAKPGQEIQFSEIREFIYELKRRKFNIRKVSADSWQSVDFLQTLHNSGYQTMTLSVDRTLEAYNFLKEAILEDRINYYVHPIFIKECRYLELIEGKKVDHPQGFCFTGDTRIALLDGTNPTFRELRSKFGDKKFPLYSMSEKGITIGWGRNSRAMGVKELIEITLDNYQVIRCTPNHLFMTLKGRWIEAKDLTNKISLMPFYRRLAFKGGWCRYERIHCPIKQKRILTHQIIAKEKFGNIENKVIHHKDGNPQNNHPDNLKLLSLREHSKFHTTKRHRKDKDYVKRLREGHKLYRENGGNEKSRQNMMKLNREGKMKQEKRSNHRIISVKRLNYKEEVWDITVDKYHNFALSSGIFVHNSKDVADAVAAISWHCSKAVGGYGVIIAGGRDGTRAPDEPTFN